MTPIIEFSTRLGSIVEGQFTLRAVSAEKFIDGDTYRYCTLHDATGEIAVRVDEASGLFNALTAPVNLIAPVQAQVYLRMHGGTLVGDLRAIRTLEAHEVGNAAAVIPLIDCPQGAREALAALVAFNQELQPEALRIFLNRLLLNPPVVATLLSSYPGNNQLLDRQFVLVRAVRGLERTQALLDGQVDEANIIVAQLVALVHALGGTYRTPQNGVSCADWAERFFDTKLIRHLHWAVAEEARPQLQT